MLLILFNGYEGVATCSDLTTIEIVEISMKGERANDDGETEDEICVLRSKAALPNMGT